MRRGVTGRLIPACTRRKPFAAGDGLSSSLATSWISPFWPKTGVCSTHRTQRARHRDHALSHSPALRPANCRFQLSKSATGPPCDRNRFVARVSVPFALYACNVSLPPINGHRTQTERTCGRLLSQKSFAGRLGMTIKTAGIGLPQTRSLTAAHDYTVRDIPASRAPPAGLDRDPPSPKRLALRSVASEVTGLGAGHRGGLDALYETCGPTIGKHCSNWARSSKASVFGIPETNCKLLL